jgi:hypothetical protein
VVTAPTVIRRIGFPSAKRSAPNGATSIERIILDLRDHGRHRPMIRKLRRLHAGDACENDYRTEALIAPGT